MMEYKKKLLLVLFISLIILSNIMTLNCSNKQTEKEEKHLNFYESLDLSSPKSALIVFNSNFNKALYVNSYVILHPELRSEFYMSMVRLKIDDLVNLNTVTPKKFRNALWEKTKEHTISQEADATLVDVMFFFDSLMRTADELDIFKIDFRGEMKIIEDDYEPDGEGNVLITTELELIITLRLTSY